MFRDAENTKLFLEHGVSTKDIESDGSSSQTVWQELETNVRAYRPQPGFGLGEFLNALKASR